MGISASMLRRCVAQVLRRALAHKKGIVSGSNVTAKEALIYSTENKSVLLYYSFSQFSAGKREKQ